MFNYSSISKIPVDKFIAARHNAQYIALNLDINFNISHRTYIGISHFSHMDPQTYLNGPKEESSLSGSMTKFTINTSNLCLHKQTVAIETIYTKKDLSSMKHISFVGEISNRSEITFWQDTVFEYRTVFVRALRRKNHLAHNLCALNLNIDPFFRIPLYSGPLKITSYSSCRDAYPAALYIITPNLEINLSWEEVNSYCESFGGHLPTITSLMEESFLTNIMETRLKGLEDVKTNCRFHPLCYIFLGLRRYVS